MTVDELIAALSALPDEVRKQDCFYVIDADANIDPDYGVRLLRVTDVHSIGRYAALGTRLARG